jgi:hypothetical protein
VFETDLVHLFVVLQKLKLADAFKSLSNQRFDEMLELLACQQGLQGRHPLRVQRGHGGNLRIADSKKTNSFTRFCSWTTPLRKTVWTGTAQALARTSSQ